MTTYFLLTVEDKYYGNCHADEKNVHYSSHKASGMSFKLCFWIQLFKEAIFWQEKTLGPFAISLLNFS